MMVSDSLFTIRKKASDAGKDISYLFKDKSVNDVKVVRASTGEFFVYSMRDD